MKWINRLISLNQEVLGINRRNLQFIYPGSPRRFYPLADDKAETKKILEQAGLPAPPTYTIISNMGGLKQRWKTVGHHDALVVKPSMGRGGGGILILQHAPGQGWQKSSGKAITDWQILGHIANIIFGVYSFGSNDKAIVEYKVNNHQMMQSLYPRGVPDIRIITFRQRPVMGMLRVPTDQSDGRANLHQGAMGIGLDISSGQIGEGVLKGHVLHQHPDTGIEFTGMYIPDWEEIIDISKRTSSVFPFEYLGIDIVLDKDLGPLIMEINIRPGLEIQNINRKSLLKALKEQTI